MAKGGPRDEEEVDAKNYPKPVPCPQPKHQLLQLKKKNYCHSIFLQTLLSLCISGKPLPQEMPSQRFSCLQETTSPLMRFDPIRVEQEGANDKAVSAGAGVWVSSTTTTAPLQLRKLVPQSPKSPHTSSYFIHCPFNTGQHKCAVRQIYVCL